MAKIRQGILGGFSGAVANVVGSSWKGIAVMKAKPLSVANPRTASQLLQRGKMRNIVDFARKILTSIIKPLWDRFASGQSGYNAFVSDNIGLFTDELPSAFDELIISKGRMAATVLDLADSHSFGNVNVEWIDDSGEGFKLASDIAYVLAINETKNEVAADSGELRSAQIQGVSLPSTIEAGDVIHTYLAFMRADGTLVSNTSYFTFTKA